MISKKLKKELTAAIIGGITLKSTDVFCTQTVPPLNRDRNCHIFIQEGPNDVHRVYLQRIPRTKLDILLFRPHRWDVVEAEDYTTMFSITDRKSSRTLQKLFDKIWAEQEATNNTEDQIKKKVLEALKMDKAKEEKSL